MKKKIGLFVGSLRKDSYSKKIADRLAKLFPEEYEAVFIDLSQLELYNQDFDDEDRSTDAWNLFRSTVKPLYGVVFVTPEYNRPYLLF